MAALAPGFDPLIAEARRRTRQRRLLVAVGALLIFCAALGTTLSMRGTSAVRPATGGPALGSVRVGYPFGFGWGQSQPTAIYNGGDSTGRVWHIVWTNWGSPTTTGVGRTPNWPPPADTSEPSSYYRIPLKIEFRASDLGRCSPTGLVSYRRLQARVQSHPGGPFGRWGNWTPTGSICHW